MRVTNKSGLHARPAALFVREARKFQSAIKVRKAGKEADAKSIVHLLTLGVSQGDEIELEVDGADEEEALGALVELIKAGLGDE